MPQIIRCFMSSIKIWISAFRLRTLPLSFALVITGAAIAAQDECLNLTVFALELSTALFLQILSNLSNDYGDTVHGADNAGRRGPQRAVQSGAISLPQMRKAMTIFATLSLASGIMLLCASYATIGLSGLITLFVIGILSIVAAITYTAGKHPYGYFALGDLSVFLFFGLVGVAGCYYLHAGTVPMRVWLMASSVGLLSVGVLNMNNIRDMDSDKQAGKTTIPILLGIKGAKTYHFCVMAAAIALLVAYLSLYGTRWQLCSLIVIPPLMSNAMRTLREQSDTFFDSQLKLISVSTFVLSVMLIIGSAA